jgi:hypothetical protein
VLAALTGSLHPGRSLLVAGRQGHIADPGAGLVGEHRARHVAQGLEQAHALTRDDDGVYDALARDATRARVDEVSARVMLGAADISRVTPVVRDRRRTHIENTTRASCHKMNALRFDFHAFGYLEDRDLTVSPRVVDDVASISAGSKITFRAHDGAAAQAGINHDLLTAF